MPYNIILNRLARSDLPDRQTDIRTPGVLLAEVFIGYQIVGLFFRWLVKPTAPLLNTHCSQHTRDSQQKKVANKWVFGRTKKPTTPQWSGQTDRQIFLI